jgi:hypothetical protein
VRTPVFPRVLLNKLFRHGEAGGLGSYDTLSEPFPREEHTFETEAYAEYKTRAIIAQKRSAE